MNLQETVKQIDKSLGDGYAKAHPELLAGALVAEALGEIDKTLVEAIQIVSDTAKHFRLF
jgi:hypothetical protein